MLIPSPEKVPVHLQNAQVMGIRLASKKSQVRKMILAGSVNIAMSLLTSLAIITDAGRSLKINKAAQS